MPGKRILIVSLALAFAHVALGTSLWASADFFDGQEGFLFGLGLMFADCGLVGFICVMTETRWPWRISMAVVGLIWMGVLLNVLYAPLPVREGCLLILIPTLVVAVVCAVARRWGWRVLRPADQPVATLRFSLRAIMLLTAGVSIALGVGVRWFPDQPNPIQEMVVIALGESVVSLVAIRTALAPGWPLASLSATVMSIVGVTYVYQANFTVVDFVTVLQVFGSQGVLTLLTLWVIRLLGYRAMLIDLDQATEPETAGECPIESAPQLAEEARES